MLPRGLDGAWAQAHGLVLTRLLRFNLILIFSWKTILINFKIPKFTFSRNLILNNLIIINFIYTNYFTKIKTLIKFKLINLIN